MYALYMYENMNKFMVDIDNQISIYNVDGLITCHKIGSARLFHDVPEQFITFTNASLDAAEWLKGNDIVDFKDMKKIPIIKVLPEKESKNENG